MITLTEVAINKIAQNLVKRGHGVGIKIGVRTTGCSGLAYVLEYVDTFDQTDWAAKFNTFEVFISPKDAPYLDGMTIDYVRQGLNEGFEFINPNEKDRCGCGESFRV
jgi:iron-sulfur cluster assembly protein